jgi:lysozyme
MRKRSRFLLFISLLLIVLLILGSLIYTGIIWPNTLAISEYAIHGIDVSNHQKEVEWAQVARSGEYRFAFIKASEGTEYRDAYFEKNWRESREQGLLRGAYHFFNENLPGDEQATNFMQMVPKEAGMLPPVLDLEVTGTDKQLMLRELKTFLHRLQDHYGLRPIIYTDFMRYEEYVQGNLDDYPLWIRNIATPMSWTTVQHWAFWQYGSRGHVPGIPGYVDLNVFSGDLMALTALTHA